MNIKRTKRHTGPLDVLGRVFLIAYSAAIVYPLLWTLSSSFKANADLFDNIFAPPSVWHFENYANAWNKANISTYFMNTVLITLGSLLLMILLTSMAAYVLARYNFRLRGVFEFLYVSGIMIPGIVGIIPLFIQLKGFGMLDNRFTMIIVNTVNMMPFSVFMLISFFKTIPTEISEAGVIDGCGKASLFAFVMLPMATPGLIPVLIIQFMNCWSEIYFSMILLSSTANKTLQIGLYNIQKVQQQRADYVTMFAAVVIVIIPSILVYVLFQRRIIQGVSMGAVKG